MDIAVECVHLLVADHVTTRDTLTELIPMMINKGHVHNNKITITNIRCFCRICCRTVGIKTMGNIVTVKNGGSVSVLTEIKHEED